MMVDAEAQLFTTLVLMFGGALACGCAPFFLRVRDAHLQTLAALGAGLMLGSALAVIIPEGFHAFNQAASHDHDHDHDHDHSGHGHDHTHAEGLPEGLAGLVLVGGFLAMLLLDHMQHAAGGSCGAPGHSHGHSHAHAHGKGEGGCAGGGHERLRERSPSPLGAGKKGASCAAGEGEAPAELKKAAGPPPAAPSDPQSAIAGLLIHCAADGLAMGAAFLGGDARLTLLIAAAMVLHKAPMAFGLATYLMACQWSFQRARPTLLAFASAAPASTLATYWLLGSVQALSSPSAVALCLVFSGGTFLHAATMHILPGVLAGGAAGRAGAPQLAAVAAGSLLPVLLSWGHQH